MVGPKPAFSYKEILQELINFDIYRNGYLKKKTDVVWIKICNKLNNYKQHTFSIKPLNLYIKVKKDIGNLLSDYRKHKNLFNSNEIIDKERDDNASSDHSDEFDEAKLKPVKGKKNFQKTITFTISLNQNEWDEISPIEKIYKNGKKCQVLKPGWPDVIVKKMWLEEKLPCTYNFKRPIIDDIESCIKIDGYCKTCNATLKIICDDKLSEIGESIKFTVKTTNTRGLPHPDKRRLAGPHRNKVKDQLKNKKPKQWQQELAFTDMDHGDCEPPSLYKLSVLQKASQETKNEALGIIPGTKIFDSLSQIKQDPEFNKFIWIIYDGHNI